MRTSDHAAVTIWCRRLVAMLLASAASLVQAGEAALPLASGWRPVALATTAVHDAGHQPGGEGAQWPQAIAIDHGDGRFMLYGTDVGGIFRSLDGGRTFAPCNVGYHPRGNCGFAIDPLNPKRALAVGANSMEQGFHGLYLTTDQGASWRQVLPRRICGYRDYREQVAFDPASYDQALGGCAVAYWSAGTSSMDKSGRLFRSADGGTTWAEVASAATYGNALVKVHPKKGVVYIANGGGLFVSSDGAASFARRIEGPVSGLDVAESRPDAVYACTSNDLLVSQDAGATFATITSGGLPGAHKLKQVRVCPQNDRRMMIESDQGDYHWLKYWSEDGGKTWAASKLDTQLSIIPTNNRQPMFAWHPQDEQQVWSFGGDYITRSGDAGATFAWANNGNNGIMVGGRFAFNPHAPDLLYLAAVDYNGALTSDGMRTWSYVDLTQVFWGGTASGGYAATPLLLYGLVGNTMKLSRDGGKTVSRVCEVKGPHVSAGDPIDANVLFCANQRSGDQGRTWSAMNGCQAVFAASAGPGHELYGRSDRSVVVSTDHGATWTTVAAVPGEIDDIAVDHVRSSLYIAARDHLFCLAKGASAPSDITERVPVDQFGQRRVYTVAVDPTDPAVVYAGGARNTYSTDTAVVRSTDAGQTWVSLIRKTDGVQSGMDGGREAIAMRVHPKSRHLLVGTGCYGLWEYCPPGATAVAMDAAGK